MQIELVLFDVDGTLVDHEAAARTAFTGWLGRPDLAPLWEIVAERHFAAYQAGAVSFAEQRRRRLREFLPYAEVDPTAWPDDRLDAFFATYLTAYRNAWLPYPGWRNRIRPRSPAPAPRSAWRPPEPPTSGTGSTWTRGRPRTRVCTACG